MSKSSPRAPSGEPRHYSVKRHVLASIGALEPGSTLASERELAAELGTSRTTVRQALAELEAEGRLVRRQRHGAYVSEPKLRLVQDRSGITDSSARARRTASTRLLGSHRLRVDALTAERLGLQRPATVNRVDRLLLIDAQPIAIESSLLAPDHLQQLRKWASDAGSLHDLLAEVVGVRPSIIEEQIEVRPASMDDASALQINVGSPLLLLRQVSAGPNGIPLACTTTSFRSDRITLTTAQELEDDASRS